MTSTRRAIQEIEYEGRKIATHPKFAWIARLGYLARGLVYLIIGSLAIVAAVSHREQIPGVRGVLLDLGHAPLGQVLSIAVGVGLLAFAVWRGVQALADTDRRGTSVEGLIVRLGWAISAIIHVVLAVYAVGIAFGWYLGASGADVTGNVGARSWSAWLLGRPGGRELLAVVGGIIVGVGISQIVQGWQGRYHRHLALRGRNGRWIDPVCKFGLIARGVVFIIIGIFVCVAALQSKPAAARGFGGALQTLLAQPFGTVLLFVVALGLIAFGLYSIIEALYHRFAPPQR